MSEILGTLFAKIVALLSLAAVAAVLFMVFGSNKIQNTIVDVTQLQTNAQAHYAGQSTFTTLTNAVAIAGKLAPDSMISGTALVNPFAGTVKINVNAANAARFDITETKLPADACSKVIVGLPAFVSLKVNTAPQTLPLDAGAAITACNTASNTVVATFSH